MVQEALATAQMIVKSTALLEYLMQFVQLGPIPITYTETCNKTHLKVACFKNPSWLTRKSINTSLTENAHISIVGLMRGNHQL